MEGQAIGLREKGNARVKGKREEEGLQGDGGEEAVRVQGACRNQIWDKTSWDQQDAAGGDS